MSRTKNWVLILSFLCVIKTSNAQNISFELLYDSVISSFSDPYCSEIFGGISAIELMPDRIINTIGKPGKKSAAKGMSLLMISDHYPNSENAGIQKSYSFQIDSKNKIFNSNIFFDLNDVESVRYNARLNWIFYSYESKQRTGIGYIVPGKNGFKKALLFDEPLPSDNRGIEGIAITSDNNLWYTYESGNKTSHGDTMAIYCIKPERTALVYSKKKQIEYLYPFDKCFCLDKDSCQTFNGTRGNGVSEMLAIKNQPGKLLVLERCFDGNRGNVRLYLVSVEKSSRILSKELVFDFNKNSIPDNLEAMAWGKDENGSQVLYILSDDNFATKKNRQRNQIVKLKMLVKPAGK